MAPASLRDSPDLQRLPDSIGGPNYLAVSRANAWDIGYDFDDPAGRKMIYETYVLPPCEKIPQQAAYSAIKNFTQNYDPTPAVEACKTPMAYISADVPLVNTARDLDRLQELCTQLVAAKTMLAGHFNTIEVADQVNAMLRSVPGSRPRPVQGLIRKLGWSAALERRSRLLRHEIATGQNETT